MTPPIDFEANPLIPVVVQDDTSRDVLMVGFMNQDAYELTQETGYVHFWSRSRNQLWKKGETSGHTQEVISIAVNCEDNSLLIQVNQNGAVCHTGHRTCYYRQVLPDGSVLETSDPVFDPADVYATLDTTTEQIWYGAYEWLRDHDLSEVSGTSRLFHELGPIPFDRIADELDELAGVLTGDHVHTDFESDLMLEGSQVLYWTAVCGAICGLHFSTDLWIPSGLRTKRPGGIEEWTISSLRDQAQMMRREVPAPFDRELRYAVQLVGDAVARAGFDPLKLIERDLTELRSRPYLADYFASVDG